MPRPKDAKIWNEDLAAALEARYQKAQREGKRDVHLWRNGLDEILAVRKDIYQFRTGSIVNLPTKLSKRVQRLCEDVIRGVKNVYPDGHVPTNGNSRETTTHEKHSRTPPRTPSSNSSNYGDNPFHNDHYMKRIKIRGGAFAILMAFKNSVTEIMTKRDICREAQPFCDETMEANYHAGRVRGAWSSISTLKSHHLVKEQGHATYTPNGFRDRPHSYSLTRNGELFIEALLSNRPEAAEAEQKVTGREPPTPFLGRLAGTIGTPASFDYPRNPPAGKPVSRGDVYSDKEALEEWLATATVGDRKEFKVGKDRRKKLHDLCDKLQRQRPGLRLTHGSSGHARGRTLSIQLVSKPPSIQSATPQTGSYKPSPSWIRSSGIPGSGPLALRRLGDDIPEVTQSSSSKPDRTARKRAGLAALKRQEEAREDIELKQAILESKKLTSTPRAQSKIRDRELQEAIQASLTETKKAPAVKRDIFAIDSSSDESLPGPIFSPSPIRKKRKTNSTPNTKKIPPLQPKEICCIDSDSEDEKLVPRAIISSPGTKQKKQTAVTNGLSTDNKAGPSSINLCESRSEDENDENEVIEIQETQEETIDLSNSQLSQDLVCIEEDDEDVGDDVVIVEDDSANGFLNIGYFLTVVIDNRERNRNATPRALRMELTRHLATGPLSHVWPPTLPPAQVKEAGLEWGDIQYTVRTGNLEPQRLGVSIERKRVNDLVQRSSSGDHLVQLYRMKQHCSLSVLLVENELRTAQNVTPYGSQMREGFDPFDPTIKNEDDVYRMFGRLVLSCDAVKFIQTRDEQASLRAIGALGLMAAFASPKFTKEHKCQDSIRKERMSDKSHGVQALSDQLTQSGIPWRLSKRVASAIGGAAELKALYDSCCNETAKSQLLSHVINGGEDHDQDDIQSSATGWSDAIYRIASCSKSSRANKLSGEAALLLHKELVEDHGFYLSTLYQGYSHEEALEKVLENPSGAPSNLKLATRSVHIKLTSEQATKYFPSAPEDGAFYKLSIISKSQTSESYSTPITMQTMTKSLASKTMSVFEMEGSDMVDLICDTLKTEGRNNFVTLAKTVARIIDNKCDNDGGSMSNDKRILMVCGLQAALDAIAKKSGYAIETKTVIDLVFAELLLCYDVTIMQAVHKKVEERIKLVKQLALACFHYGYLVQNI